MMKGLYYLANTNVSMCRRMFAVILASRPTCMHFLLHFKFPINSVDSPALNFKRGCTLVKESNHIVSIFPKLKYLGILHGR